MRDPKRIPILIDELKAFWIKNPDLRLGQIMLIAGKKAGCGEDIWNIEDKELIDALTDKSEWEEEFSTRLLMEQMKHWNQFRTIFNDQKEEAQ